MADEETPFDDLDIGYFEFPLPTTQELTVVRFLDKTGVARLWAKIGDKFFKIPYGGEVGQILVKTDNGISWGDSFSLPDGGSTGQALVKTDSGYGWGDVETDIPEASETEYGIVKYATLDEFYEYIGLIV